MNKFLNLPKSCSLEPELVNGRFDAAVGCNSVFECSLQVGAVELLVTFPDILAKHEASRKAVS